jgi:hypothetical protein
VNATSCHTPVLGAAASPLSAAAGVRTAAVLEAVAGGAPTPITAAGSRVVDAMPGAVKDWSTHTLEGSASASGPVGLAAQGPLRRPHPTARRRSRNIPSFPAAGAASNQPPVLAAAPIARNDHSPRVARVKVDIRRPGAPGSGLLLTPYSQPA